MRVNKKSIIGLAALAAVSAIGGSLAYWNQELSAHNEFTTGKYDSEIVEEFIPPVPGEWVPGSEIEKRVTVTNSGNVKLAVTAEIDQVWTRTEDVMAKDENGNDVVVAPAKGENFTLKFDKDGESVYASLVNWGANVTALDSVAEIGADLGIKGSAASLSEADGKWVLVSAKADDYGYSNIRFVYAGILNEDGKTEELLTSVTLNPHINTSVTAKNTVIKVNEDGSKNVTTTTDTNAKYGYDSSQYIMTVKATTVQASEAAIREIFGSKKYADDSAQIDSTIIDDFINTYKDVLLKDDADNAA